MKYVYTWVYLLIIKAKKIWNPWFFLCIEHNIIRSDFGDKLTSFLIVIKNVKPVSIWWSFLWHYILPEMKWFIQMCCFFSLLKLIDIYKISGSLTVHTCISRNWHLFRSQNPQHVSLTFSLYIYSEFQNWTLDILVTYLLS